MIQVLLAIGTASFGCCSFFIAAWVSDRRPNTHKWSHTADNIEILEKDLGLEPSVRYAPRFGSSPHLTAQVATAKLNAAVQEPISTLMAGSITARPLAQMTRSVYDKMLEHGRTDPNFRVDWDYNTNRWVPRDVGSSERSVAEYKKKVAWAASVRADDVAAMSLEQYADMRGMLLNRPVARYRNESEQMDIAEYFASTR